MPQTRRTCANDNFYFFCLSVEYAHFDRDLAQLRIATPDSTRVCPADASCTNTEPGHKEQCTYPFHHFDVLLKDIVC